jgi:hypothetical protein
MRSRKSLVFLRNEMHNGFEYKASSRCILGIFLFVVVTKKVRDLMRYASLAGRPSLLSGLRASYMFYMCCYFRRRQGDSLLGFWLEICFLKSSALNIVIFQIF